MNDPAAFPDFKRIDGHALRASASVTSSIDDLAAYLARPAASDTEKARSLFRWITANIAYDVQGYFNPRGPSHQSPSEALRAKKGVCAAYSSLFHALADRVGLHVATISGHGKGYSYVVGEPTDGSNHDWNAVCLDGEWKLIDCTWGAGHVDERRRFRRSFDEFYFLTPPRLFIFSHFPEEPRWQLLPQPIERPVYDGLLCVQPLFFKLGVRPVSHRSVRIECEGPVEIHLKAKQDISMSAKWEGTADKRGLPRYLVRRTGSGFVVHACCPTREGGTLAVYAKGRREPGEARRDTALQGSSDDTGLHRHRLLSSEFCGVPSKGHPAHLPRGRKTAVRQAGAFRGSRQMAPSMLPW